MSGEFPEPRSRLFLTCDLVGSTRFKERNVEWITSFLNFYSEFPGTFARALRRLPGAASLEPQLWKAVGDELIFEVAVSSETDVVLSITAWLAAMDEYDEARRKKASIARETDAGASADTAKHRSDRAAEAEEEGSSDYLLAQGSAFLAVTPWPNRKVGARLRPTLDSPNASGSSHAPQEEGIIESARAVAAEDVQEYFYDYLGPSFDTGFRVSTLRSPRHFTLSLEVAWILAQAHVSSLPMGLPLTWLGSHGLKGVWGSQRYPVYAIDRDRHRNEQSGSNSGDAYDQALWDVHGVDGQGCRNIIALGEAASLQRETPVNLFLSNAHHRPFRLSRPELDEAVLQEQQSRLVDAADPHEEDVAVVDDPDAML